MSIAFNGTTQYAHIVAVPSVAAFLVAGWFRRDSDSAWFEWQWSVDAGDATNRTSLKIDIIDRMRAERASIVEIETVDPAVVSTWYYVMVRYATGTLTVQHLVDGGSAWVGNASVGSLADLAPTAFGIGAMHFQGTPAFFAPLTSAGVKVWSTTLPSDAEVLAEREYRNAIVTAGLWATYRFKTGALADDHSGNARTLTLTATPTFSADDPTAILGDSASAGGGGRLVSGALLGRSLVGGSLAQ